MLIGRSMAAERKITQNGLGTAHVWVCTLLILSCDSSVQSTTESGECVPDAALESLIERVSQNFPNASPRYCIGIVPAENDRSLANRSLPSVVMSADKCRLGTLTAPRHSDDRGMPAVHVALSLSTCFSDRSGTVEVTTSQAFGEGRIEVFEMAKTNGQWRVVNVVQSGIM